MFEIYDATEEDCASTPSSEVILTQAPTPVGA